MPPIETLETSRYALPDSITADALSPTLVIYLDRVRHNIATVIRHVGGDPDRWRAHVKTAKIPEVLRELVLAGVRNFKCATTREADVLLSVLHRERVTGCDLLVAYPLLGPNLRRLAALAADHEDVRISVLCEDPEHVGAIPESLSIFVDVNPGMNRTGVPVADIMTIHRIAERAAGRFRGVHHYEGHLNTPDLDARRRDAERCYARLVDLLSVLADVGGGEREVTTSGTPTFAVAWAGQRLAELPGIVHRVSPGTVIYHDVRTEERNAALELEPAALLMTRVISRPAADVVTCDAGSKSIAAETGDPCAVVLGRPELQALTPSEEHLPLRVLRGEPPARGETLLLVPQHVCPTVNLADDAVLVDDGAVVGVVPVAARGHETLDPSALRMISSPRNRP